MEDEESSIRILNSDQIMPFKDVVMGGIYITNEGKPMKPLAVPRREGWNIIEELDFKDYREGVLELQYSVVG